MKINKIKKELAGNKDYLERNFYIKEIGIFGSFALGVEDDDSDVDGKLLQRTVTDSRWRLQLLIIK